MTRLEEIIQCAKERYYGQGNFHEAQSDIEYLLRLIRKMELGGKEVEPSGTGKIG